MTGAIPRRAYWVILHLAIVLAFARHVIAPLVDRGELAATDFTAYYTGWSLVLTDPARTYDLDAQRRVQAEVMRDRRFDGVNTFFYPPHAAVAFAPLAALSLENAFRLWTVGQLACLVLLIRGLFELAGLGDGRRRQPSERLDRWVLATAVLAFLPLLYTLQIGQVSIAMTLALLGFWRAFARGRDAQAGLWLLAVTVKPQLLPVPLLLLAASRRWRPAAWLCVWGAPVVLAATWVLGPRVWLDYPGKARHLEGFVAGGTHDYMLNLRGVLTRLGGAGHDGVILAVSAAALLVASVAIYRLYRRAAIRGTIPAGVFAAGLALALPVNLHLHLQDELVWVLPLVLLAAHARAGEGASGAAPAPLSDRFEVFALSWPLVFVLTSAIETAAGRLLPIPPPLVLAVVLIVWAWPMIARTS